MLNTVDHDDTGDETLNRYRYQHAYGLMLALGSLRNTGGNVFTAIYCEHHEDLIGELVSGKFYAFQVKTRKKELGYWTLSDDAVVKSICRFVSMYQKFGDNVDRFVFVSNAELSDVSLEIRDARKKSLSPKLLLDSCHSCENMQDLPSGVRSGFDKLCQSCGCNPEDLFAVLKRTEFFLGPDLNAYEAEITMNALPYLPQCAQMNHSQLRRLVRELIEKFTYASGLPVDPDAHIIPIDGTKHGITTVKAKRVDISDISAILDRGKSRFLKAPVSLEQDLELSALKPEYQILVRKLEAGGLSEQIPAMQRRLLSAFEWAREQQLIDVQSAERQLRQLEAVVESVYADEHALKSILPAPWGKQLYVGMLEEFRRLHSEEQIKVCYQDSDRLFGIAGLLSEACRIWWSPPFEIETAS